MTKDEALRLALEALEWSKPHADAEITYQETMTAIKAALEAKDEPVAWRWMPAPYWKQWVYSDDSERVEEAKRFMGDGGVQPLYTTPPQRKPLTDEEIEKLFLGATGGSYLDAAIAFARAIEAAHGIKGEA